MMARDDSPQKTLVQQIHEELFASIETLDAFGTQCIQQLRKLAEAGELKKPKKVTDVILPIRKGEHEAAGTGD
jgi:hypothetical protein